jgi:hypothetical protein
MGSVSEGRSGNPNGRPKGARGLKTDLRAELSARVRITENGKSISVSKQQLVVKALVAKAAKGDPRASAQIIALVGQLFGLEGEQSGQARLPPGDQAILDAFLKRNASEGDEKGDEGDGDDPE